MSDKSFYTEAKKVMRADFFPTTSTTTTKVYPAYTSLNPFKHFLKKKELFTPAETAEMQNHSKVNQRRINLKITKTTLSDATAAATAATGEVPTTAKTLNTVERTPLLVDKPIDYGEQRYPNQTLGLDPADSTITNEENTQSDDNSKIDDDKIKSREFSY